MLALGVMLVVGFIFPFLQPSRSAALPVRSAYQTAPPVSRRSGHETQKSSTALIADDAVTDAKLRDSAARSVIGRAAATVGDPADIVASADGQVLRRSAGTLAFALITNAEVDAAAAIAGSKLQALSVGANAGVIPSTGVADAHVSATAAIAGSKLQALSVGANAGVIPSTGVADAHVSATAAIAQSKLSLTTGLGGIIPGAGITDAHVVAANKDGVAGTASMRTLGTGAQQACPGNDARLSDARAPTAHAASHAAGGSDAVTKPGLVAGGATSTTNNQTEYFHPMGLRTPAAAEDAIYRFHVRRAMKLKNFIAVLNQAFGGGTVAVTVRVDGADSTISVTFSSADATAATKTDNDEVTVNANSYITVKTVNSGAGSGVAVGWSFELEPS